MARINSHLSAVRRQRLPVGRQGFGDDADNFLSLRSFHFFSFLHALHLLVAGRDYFEKDFGFHG
jgi:hypothetical protein